MLAWRASSCAWASCPGPRPGHRGTGQSYEKPFSVATTETPAYPDDTSYDYEPWIRQVEASTVSALVQRTNERIVAADVFGSEYVSSPIFEARLLKNESAVDDLRRQVHAALVTARDRDNVDAITELTYQIEAASHNVHKASRTDTGLLVCGDEISNLGVAPMALGIPPGRVGSCALAADCLRMLE